MLDERERLSRIEANAVPVGASARKGKVTITASELSRIDDQLYLSYELNDPGRAAKRRKEWNYGNDILRVDGLEAHGVSVFGTSNTGDDLLSYSEQYELPMDPARLPEESWIHLRTYKGNKADMELVFRFNWQTNTATLPMDKAEEELWLADEYAPWASTLPKSDEPRSVFYSLKDLEPMDTPDGTIRLLWIQVNYDNSTKRSHPLYGPITRIYYELDHSAHWSNDSFVGIHEPLELEIRGKRPSGIGAYTPNGINPNPKEPTTFQVAFTSAFDPLAGDGKIPVVLNLPYSNSPVEPLTFRYEFEIDPEKLIVKPPDDISVFSEE